MSELVLTRPQYLELEKLGLGAFKPLAGFMNEDEFHAAVGNHAASGRRGLSPARGTGRGWGDGATAERLALGGVEL
jgi:hypothetical protein